MEVSSEAGTEGITGWGKGNERKKGISSWFGSILCPWRNGVCNKKPSGIQGLGRVSSGTSDYPHRGKQKKEDFLLSEIIHKTCIYRNLLGGLYRENPVKSRNYEAVKSSKKWENVGNSYIIPALLLYRYSYI